MKDLATFLGATYSKDIKLAGIIYLHRITDNRLGGHAFRNLAMFQKLCGNECLKKVVLATSMWDKLKDAEAFVAAESAEAQLISKPTWWGDMIEEGSKVFRQDDGLRSALRIIDYIMSLRGEGVIPHIARELVDDHKTLEQTTAGQEVQRELLEARRQHAEELQATRESLQAAIKAGNERAAQKLAAMEGDLLQQGRKHDEQIEELKKDHARIQKDNDEANKKKIAELQAQTKKFERAATASMTRIETLTSEIRENKTAHATLKADMEVKDKLHKAEFARRDAEWKAEQASMTQLLLDERAAREQEPGESSSSGAGGFFSVLGGACLTGIGALTLNPAIMAAGVAVAARGGYAATR